MNRLFLILLAGMILFSSTAWAEASDKAYEKANENAVFQRIGDWFATVGKSEEDREAILAERKAERMAKRSARDAKEMKEKSKKEMDRAAGMADKTMKESHGKAKKAAGGMMDKMQH